MLSVGVSLPTLLDISSLVTAVTEELRPIIRAELEVLFASSKPPEQRLTTDDVSALLKVSPATVRAWAKEGCPHIRVGHGACRFVLSELEAWLKYR